MGFCNVNFTLIIRKNGKYYTYRSTNHKSWLPTITNIVGIFGANNNQLLIKSIVENIIFIV